MDKLKDNLYTQIKKYPVYYAILVESKTAKVYISIG